MERCKSCGAPIFFAVTAKDRRMPLDWEACDGGNVQIVNGVAVVGGPYDDGQRYTSHFATCPAAKDHRRPRVGGVRI